MATPQSALADQPHPGSERTAALDAFRGLTIAFMVLVNDPGDPHHVYAPLKHAEWNGWTPTDLVFPSFLWIAGVAMTLSLSKRLQQGVPKQTLFLQTLRRSAIIFILGLVVYVAPHFSLSTQRIMGVLQRIAICHCAGAAIFLTTRLRGQLVWIAGLLSVYWLLMAFAPVPGYGHGRLDVDGNFAHYVDRIVLGAHNYAHTKTWDPEGIVSTLPAIATLLFGILGGRILQIKRPLNQRTLALLFAGALLIAAGLICNIWLPINKKLWTTSFALFMAGMDFGIFAVFLWLVDGLGFRRIVRPFAILGMNSIVIYMISELLAEALDAIGAQRVVAETSANVSLLWALAYTGLMFLIAWFMYRRRWIVRV